MFLYPDRRSNKYYYPDMDGQRAIAEGGADRVAHMCTPQERYSDWNDHGLLQMSI